MNRPFLKKASRTTAWLMLVSLVLLPIGIQADFGDYVDPSFECPAKTTCPQVCVASAEDCPSVMRCEKDTDMVCADGSCAPFCDPDLVSPCSKACAPVACPKIVATFEACVEAFTPYYEFAEICDAILEAEENGGTKNKTSGPSFTWSDPAFIFVYCWFGGVSAGIVLWCWYK